MQAAAQNVAINNDGSLPTIGAILDVKSTSKGILVPRIALTGTNDITTIPNRVESLLIYNTATIGGANAISAGFYYWSGLNWVRLTSNTSSLFSGWLLGGNAGTSPAIHFLGTADNSALLFRVNNEKAGYVGVQLNDGNVFWGYQSGNNNSGYSNVGIGIRTLLNNTTRNNLVAIGDSALFNNTIGTNNTAVGSKSLFSNSTGAANTANGYNALYSNTTGVNNTAVGNSALFSNTTARYNTATGNGALYQNTVGEYNTASGDGVLGRNTSGNDNAAIGLDALSSNTTGSMNAGFGNYSLLGNTTGNSNTGIGFFADVSNGNLSNATAIGYNSRVDCSNCMALGSNSDQKVGIGMGFPAYPLNFASTLGDKISFYGTAVPHYGIGIQNFLMQLYTEGPITDIAFGYGSSAIFSENMRIKGNGNLRLGTTNLNATLTFGSGLSEKIILYAGVSGNAGFGVFGNELRIHSDYSGADITFGYDLPPGYRENMRITGAAGNLLVRGSVTANSSFYTSDARLKKEVQPILHALEKISQLQGYNYYWQDEEQDHSIQTGVIAQEVQKVFPELVRADNNGMLSVNYVGLIPYVIQSIKEQQQQISLQKNRIDQLSKENEELKQLKTELAELKKLIQQLSAK